VLKIQIIINQSINQSIDQSGSQSIDQSIKSTHLRQDSPANQQRIKGSSQVIKSTCYHRETNDTNRKCIM